MEYLLIMNKKIVVILFAICTLGLTINSVSLVQLFGLDDKIESITPISLNIENESNVIILKAKIESLESTLKAKDKAYGYVIAQNRSSMITSLILFNLLFLLLLYVIYFKKRKA